MPRGRYWYGPGFWKRGTGWAPGMGGFRGGAFSYGRPYFGGGPRWGFCWYYPDYGPDMAWADELQPEDEARFLKYQAEQIRAELQEIEKRLADLTQEKEQES